MWNRALLAGFLAATAVACLGAASREESSITNDALSANQIDIVGGIGVGETRSLRYEPAAPMKYVGLTFTGDGSFVALSAHSTDAQHSPMIWLGSRSESEVTLLSSSISSAELRTVSGTNYLVVLRERDYRATDFVVSLTRQIETIDAGVDAEAGTPNRGFDPAETIDNKTFELTLTCQRTVKSPSADYAQDISIPASVWLSKTPKTLTHRCELDSRDQPTCRDFRVYETITFNEVPFPTNRAPIDDLLRLVNSVPNAYGDSLALSGPSDGQTLAVSSFKKTAGKISDTAYTIVWLDGPTHDRFHVRVLSSRVISPNTNEMQKETLECSGWGP